MLRLKVLESIGLFRPLAYDQKRFNRLAKTCNEIEAIFWSVSYFELSNWGLFTPQKRVDGYRLDFALEGNGFKVAIEIDGQDHHTTQADRAADYQRERNLKRRGWRFVRFTASEIYKDPQRCVSDVLGIVRGYYNNAL